jgi:UDP-N-acetylglucosamine 2-epimerase
MRKICVVTGSRAEYGLLRLVMEGIRDSPELELQVIAPGVSLTILKTEMQHKMYLAILFIIQI